jgi:hypothetical protein
MASDEIGYERMTMAEVGEWVRDVEAGEYLVEYEDTGLTAEQDPGSRCGFGDDELDQISRWLGERGLKLEADDVGLVVVEVRS